jgi:hypothetical protein
MCVRRRRWLRPTTSACCVLRSLERKLLLTTTWHGELAGAPGRAWPCARAPRVPGYLVVVWWRAGLPEMPRRGGAGPRTTRGRPAHVSRVCRSGAREERSLSVAEFYLNRANHACILHSVLERIRGSFQSTLCFTD